jgi:hypothetical protein
MLLEGDGIILLVDAHICHKFVRLGDRVHRFQIITTFLHRENLPGPLGSDCLDGRCRKRASKISFEKEPEAGWNTIFANLQIEAPELGFKGARAGMDWMSVGSVILSARRRIVCMAVAERGIVIVTGACRPAQKPGADNIDHQPETSDRNGFAKVDRHRGKEPANGFIADKESNHGQNNGAGKAGEIAELASTEGEARIVCVLSGICAGQRRKE